MRTSALTSALCTALILAAAQLPAITVRAPLVGALLAPSDSGGFSWYTETRIWNPNSTAANITVTDVIGIGNAAIRSFTVPAQGVLDLPYYAFLSTQNPPPSNLPSLLAVVEFTCDVPIVVTTQLSGSLPHGFPSPGPSPVPPFLGGSQGFPVAGPLIDAFKDYIEPGTMVALQWLTGSRGLYRTNLFLTNPGTRTVTVSIVFRTAMGDKSVTKNYEVAPHSMLIRGNIFFDPDLFAVVDSNSNAMQGAVTATMSADGPFYGFAGVIAGSPTDDSNYFDLLNRLAIVQPVAVP
jgi:hypothetical protein